MNLLFLSSILCIAFIVWNRLDNYGDFEVPSFIGCLLTGIITVVLIISAIIGPIDDRLFIKKFNQAQQTINEMRAYDRNEKMNAVKMIQDLNADLIDRQYCATNPWVKFASDPAVLDLKPIQ